MTPTTSAEKDEEHSHTTIKPGAPVLIDAELRAAAGSVEVRFLIDAEDVNIRLGGSDGLTVHGRRIVVKGGSFAKNESFKVDCRYTVPENRAGLVVSVDGTFNGRYRGSVASFRPNPDAPALGPDHPGEVTHVGGLTAIEMPPGSASSKP